MKSCFSYPDLEKLLEKYPFLVYELLTPTDIQNRYFNGREKQLTAFEHVNYALTVFKPRRT